MVDQASVQAKVAFGLGKAASKLGSLFTVYRPTTAMNPLQQQPLRTQYASFQAASAFSFTTTNKLSKGDAYGLFDTSDVQVGDIFTGDRTYFVAAFEPIEPPLCQQANLTVTIFDVDARTATRTLLPAGDVMYSGRTIATDDPIATGWPCYALMKAKGDFSATKLPDDVRSGNFECVLPPIPGVVIALGQRMTDQLGTAYMIGGVEPLAYGCVKFMAALATT